MLIYGKAGVSPEDDRKKCSHGRAKAEMKCPYCGNAKTKVIDSRAVEDGSAIRRRRHCGKCSSRFTTFERREKSLVSVVKRDGVREPYDREKLASGMYKATTKRNVPEEVIERSIDAIEEVIMRQPDREIDASLIGGLVMDNLRGIDEVAYLRFASVYKGFEDVSEFERELEELTAEEVDRPAT